MSFQWEKIAIDSQDGCVPGIAPVIISASRSTDIPAFYSDWLMHRLHCGYVKWINRFNGSTSYISFEKTRALIFWTKNPKPMFRHLPDLDRMNYNYYFTFTLNDYESENLEPYIPPLEERIRTFQQLADRIGKEKVIWRFDPLIITKSITADRLLEKICAVGEKIIPYTEKLVISFIDIKRYRKVHQNLLKAGFGDSRESADEDIIRIASSLHEINSRWMLDIRTCAERVDLSPFGILHNKCIDDQLMLRLFPADRGLMDFLEHNALGKGKRKSVFKDNGQRKDCGCIPSKDIGQYNTCMHLCAYCYANASRRIVESNYAQYQSQSCHHETILGK